MNDLNLQINNNQERVKKTFLSPKIIFIILGLAVAVELIYALKVLTAPIALTSPPKVVAPVKVAAISLSAPKKNFTVGETIPVTVNIDTGKFDILGVDLVVRFDPKIVEATPAGLIRGKMFNEYPLLSVDKSKGLISISGISSLGSSFRGTGQFAQLNLKAKAPGKVSLVIDFQKGSTTASNLVERASSKNILESVYNLELAIQ